MREEWSGFKPGNWSEDTTVNVRDFIQLNYTPYEGVDSFLAKPTEATKKLSAEMEALFKKEPFKRGQLIKCGRFYEKFKQRKTENGWEQTDIKEWWLNDYELTDDLEKNK